MAGRIGFERAELTDDASDVVDCEHDVWREVAALGSRAAGFEQTCDFRAQRIFRFARQLREHLFVVYAGGLFEHAAELGIDGDEADAIEPHPGLDLQDRFELQAVPAQLIFDLDLRARIDDALRQNRGSSSSAGSNSQKYVPKT